MNMFRNSKKYALTFSGKPMKKLTDLAMNSNRLRMIPGFLSSLSGLQTLDLGDNAISEVGDDDLAGLGDLYGLKLAGNRIKALTNKTFAHVKNVQILNLAHNKVGYWRKVGFLKIWAN